MTTPGLKAARKAVLPGARWQRCQFHLAQNAVHHAPNLAIRKTIGEELRAVWNAPNLDAAEAELKRLVAAHRAGAPKLAVWMEKKRAGRPCRLQTPQGASKAHVHFQPHRKLDPAGVETPHTKNRVFPNEASLNRLASAILVEIDEQWAASHKPYLTFNNTGAD